MITPKIKLWMAWRSGIAALAGWLIGAGMMFIIMQRIACQ